LFGNDGTALQRAINKGSVEIATYLLREAHADPNIINPSNYTTVNNRSPLFAAVCKKSLPLLNLLLEAHVDPKQQLDILPCAAIQGGIEVTERLLDAGVEIDAMARNSYNGSALNVGWLQGSKMW
jgi:ankyrin repeat protein